MFTCINLLAGVPSKVLSSARSDIVGGWRLRQNSRALIYSVIIIVCAYARTYARMRIQLMTSRNITS